MTVCDVAKSTPKKGLYTKVHSELWEEDTSVAAFALIPHATCSSAAPDRQEQRNPETPLGAQNLSPSPDCCSSSPTPYGKGESPSSKTRASDQASERAQGDDLVVIDEDGTLRCFRTATWRCTAVRRGYSGVNQLHCLRWDRDLS